MTMIKRCMTRHLEVYAGLDVATKFDLARVRDAWVANQQAELKRQQHAIIEHRDDLVQSQLQLNEQNGVPDCIGSSRLSDDELLGICEMLDILATRNEQPDRWLAKTSVPPPP